jgi:hypothetical protein
MVEAMEVLTRGTKEYLVVEITDTLNNLTTLSGADPTFDVVTDDDDETAIVTGQSCIIQDMLALCLMDTTDEAFAEGNYKAFVKFNALPEVPRLGPFRFRVDD